MRSDIPRQLRKRQTPEEKILWDLLRNRQLAGNKFRRQHRVGKFILDFYCAEKKLGVEVDGRIHDKQKDYDSAREEVLAESGIDILRIKNEELHLSKGRVLAKILAALT